MPSRIRANSHGRQTGTYTLTVSSSLGSATSSSAATTRSSGTLAPGSTIRGTLVPSDMQTDSGWYHDDYTFTGSRDQVIYVDMVSSDFDAYLDIYDGDTRLVATNDDGGEGLNARIAYTLPASGTYTICARSRYANRTGSYSVQLR